jgi:hypothetical protein
MNKLTTWLMGNRIAASLGAFFVLATAGLGWLAYSAWDDYATSQGEYLAQSSKLTNLSHKSPFPNQANLTRFRTNLDNAQKNLDKLRLTLGGYRIRAFNNLDKAKPQDAPQLFQDALRNEVLRIKSIATTSGATLPPGFYLALEEYENKLPQPEETLSLAKKLSILSWTAETLVSQKGLILTDFASVVAPQSSKKEPARKTLATTESSPPPFKIFDTMRIGFRCNQGSFREIVNAISSAPWFLLIDGIQIQNTSMEPPHRDAVNPSGDPHDTSNSTQKLPIIVGREQLNIVLKIRSLEFPASEIPSPVSQVAKGKAN